MTSIPADVVAVPSRVSPIDFLCEAGIQNVSLTDTGLRLDDRILVVSTLSTLYGMLLEASNASWLKFQ